ncbi:MAG: addiction module protein [Planctomycetota bacterium]
MKIEIEREEDGRWIAEISDLAGVMAYGRTRKEAVSKVKAIRDSIASERSSVPVPQSHKNELDKRLKAHASNPDDLLFLQELQARIDRGK